MNYFFKVIFFTKWKNGKIKIKIKAIFKLRHTLFFFSILYPTQSPSLCALCLPNALSSFLSTLCLEGLLSYVLLQIVLQALIKTHLKLSQQLYKIKCFFYKKITFVSYACRWVGERSEVFMKKYKDN